MTISLKAAQQFLVLNGITDVVSIQIEACENAITPGDPELCTTPPKKLVRVTVTQNVRLFFLPIIGFDSVPITVDAVSEAASVDLVLLIDTSSSMAQTVSGGEADPSACNPSDCHPMEEIKDAAKVLVDHLFLGTDGNPGYDRVAIVTFDRFPKVQLEMTDDKDLINDTLDNLTVYAGERECEFAPGDLAAAALAQEGPCRSYNADGSYWGLWSPAMELNGDPRGWMVTNSGGGLKACCQPSWWVISRSFSPAPPPRAARIPFGLSSG